FIKPFSKTFFPELLNPFAKILFNPFELPVVFLLLKLFVFRFHWLIHRLVYRPFCDLFGYLFHLQFDSPLFLLAANQTASAFSLLSDKQPYSEVRTVYGLARLEKTDTDICPRLT
ncbi:hypothetical protein CH330_00650, partial [candidate division WOR-3 bacterium JGI_Cruoil_03_51_56]